MPVELERGSEPAGRMVSWGMTPTLPFLPTLPWLVPCALSVALERPVSAVPAWPMPLTPPLEPACALGHQILLRRAALSRAALEEQSTASKTGAGLVLKSSEAVQPFCMPDRVRRERSPVLMPFELTPAEVEAAPSLSSSLRPCRSLGTAAGSCSPKPPAMLPACSVANW